MADTGPFALNEKVLVPHTDKFYEAKVLKAQKREDGLWYYLLHYTGESKSILSVLQAELLQAGNAEQLPAHSYTATSGGRLLAGM
jgi:hypothetical protein